MLSLVSPSDDTSVLFARGANSSLLYRFLDRTHGWASRTWQSLGGEFVGQPSAASVREGRIDLVGLWRNQTAMTQTYGSETWGTGWTSLGGSCSTQPVMVSYGTDKLSLLCLDADQSLVLKYYKGEWRPAGSEWQDLGGKLAGTPAIGSPVTDRVDIVGVNASSASSSGLTYMRYVEGEWSAWEGNWGDFQGDPAVLSLGYNRTEYFAVSTKGEMWTNAWIPGTKSTSKEYSAEQLPEGYTTPLNLGGKLESSPVAIALNESRVDVLAVGTDDRLKHKARVDGKWADDWEDLGGYFESAPVTWVNGSSVVVFGLGPDGAVVHGLFEVGDALEWGSGRWFDDGGDMNSAWFSLDS